VGSRDAADLSHLIKSARLSTQILICLMVGDSRCQTAERWPGRHCAPGTLSFDFTSLALLQLGPDLSAPRAVEPGRQEHVPAFKEPVKGYDCCCYLCRNRLDIAF
jgi:hypothetical protein